METRRDRNAAADYTRGYEEGYVEAFDMGFKTGVSAAKQKLLTFFAEDDDLPDSITAWLQA